MAGRLHGEHIMVLNDVAEILDLFKEILEEGGYTVTLGSMVPGEIGRTFKEVQRVMPDLLIADFLFGHEPLGWQLIQMLRMDRSTVALPIVVCTAAVTAINELNSHLGVMGIGVVIKPFDVDALLDEVRRVLDRAKADLTRMPESKRSEK